jgi:NAD+ synthase
VGCAHASEKLLGLYVKFGIDDCADLMPLGNLYRSHVLILARYLGVPQQIVARTPSPDVVPGIEDKYRDVFGVDSGTMDLVLLGLEREMPADEIARHTGLQVSQIEDIARLIEQTYHMREPGIVPSIPPKELYAT